MADETVQPASSVAPSGAAAPPAQIDPEPPKPTELVNTPGGDDAAIVGKVVGVTATRSDADVESLASHVVEDVKTLASEAEVAVERATEAAYREADRLEAEANQAVGTLSGMSVGVLHSDSIYREAPKVGNEGPHQEQIHTSLKAG